MFCVIYIEGFVIYPLQLSQLMQLSQLIQLSHLMQLLQLMQFRQLMQLSQLVNDLLYFSASSSVYKSASHLLLFSSTHQKSSLFIFLPPCNLMDNRRKNCLLVFPLLLLLSHSYVFSSCNTGNLRNSLFLFL